MQYFIEFTVAIALSMDRKEKKESLSGSLLALLFYWEKWNCGERSSSNKARRDNSVVGLPKLLLKLSSLRMPHS